VQDDTNSQIRAAFRELHHLPANPYNPHAWVSGNPSIGEGVWIGAFCTIDGTGGLEIGEGCDISNGAAVLTHSTVRRCLTERQYPHIDYKPTRIGDHVFIGVNAVVLAGCTIGHHSVIGAGAVVLEDTEVPPYSLVVGVPARVAGSVKVKIEQWQAENQDP